MKTRFALLLFIFSATIACSGNKVEQPDDVLTALRNDSLDADSRLTELARTILNFQAVVKLSKAEFIRNKYGEVFVTCEQRNLSFTDSVIFQNGFALKVTKDTIPSDKPCYRFKEIEIRNDSASVLLHFDITGFVCDGKLNYIDGEWVPDKEFRIGYR